MIKLFLILLVYSSALISADQLPDKQNTFNKIKNILNKIGKFNDEGKEYLNLIDEYRGDYCSIIITHKESVQGALDLELALWVRLKDLISTDETNTELARLELSKNYKSCNITFNCSNSKCVIIASKDTLKAKAFKKPYENLLILPIQCPGSVDLLRAFNHQIQLCGGKPSLVDKSIPPDDPFANRVHDKNDNKTEIDTNEIQRQALMEWQNNKNAPNTIKLFKLACETGLDPIACWNLGDFIKNIQNNFPDSIQWYKKSCELGDKDACVVANSFTKSLKDPKGKKMADIKNLATEFRDTGNILEAARLYKLACDTGENSDACWNLAELRRVEFKDLKGSKEWFTKACEFGDQEACIEKNKY